MTSNEKILEAALIEFFLREEEGTLEEFYQSLPKPPSIKDRTCYGYAIWRLRQKGILESAQSINRWRNYRISEQALHKGIHTIRRGCHAINDYSERGSDECGDRPRAQIPGKSD